MLAPANYGFFHPARDGEPGRPIVFRADPNDFCERDLKPGQRGHHEFVRFPGLSLAYRKHVYVEGVLSTGTIDLFYAEDCVVRRCRVHRPDGISCRGAQGARVLTTRPVSDGVQGLAVEE